ncbi:IPT/TIG domain-containing protein [Paracidobacterium acidisoli]|uniref:IPT/TIG domain-containing protein n=1 Tax=Paracidobacterium acidisoli TaxID=2303751 RepID=A0A372IJM0_9BACT|nr:IPT/TIG domain-containing protein [Paracidobacterium acidisoli]MBT9332955.1 IPT/TIG domain-containing protein [Paracidobacterium acidisoli]
MLQRWRSIHRLFFSLVLLTGLSVPAWASTTATITVGGSEQQINGAWDQGSLNLAFNGFVETIGYGEFSSPASIASAIAGKFSNDYAASGLCAHAVGSTITFQLQGSATFGQLTTSQPTSSFELFGASGWTGVGSSNLFITGLSLFQGPVQMGLVITGTNFGSSASSVTLNGVEMPLVSWGANSITAQVPAGATSGNIVVTVNGTGSNGIPFTVTGAFGCN